VCVQRGAADALENCAIKATEVLMIPLSPKSSTSAAVVVLLVCLFVSTKAIGQEIATLYPTRLDDYASSSGRLEIDPSPDVVFLSMFFRGGGLGIQSAYTFFGDGLVRIEQFRGYATSTPFESSSAHISTIEKELLLEEILSGRLMTADPAAIAAQARERGEILLQVQDDEMVVVTLSLVARQGDDGSPARVDNRFTIDAIALQQPFADEWESLARISTFAAELRARAIAEVAE
jgi:hypothetical protein